MAMELGAVRDPARGGGRAAQDADAYFHCIGRAALIRRRAGARHMLHEERIFTPRAVTGTSAHGFEESRGFARLGRLLTFGRGRHRARARKEAASLVMHRHVVLRSREPPMTHTCHQAPTTSGDITS